MEQYKALCAGKELRPANVTKHLQSHYHYGHGKNKCPYCPRKVEVVNRSPYIAMVHEMITNSEMDDVIKKADPKMRRSQVIITDSEGGSREDDIRIRYNHSDSIVELDIRQICRCMLTMFTRNLVLITSEQAWLVEWEVASLDRLTKRLESFLRLRLYSTRDAELYQV